MKEIKPLIGEDHLARTSAGEAYGFFDCMASKGEIEAELPTIRKLAGTPSQLELSLTENDGNLEGTSELNEIAKKARNAGIKYMIRANYPNATNRIAADETATILNQAYQSPLYQEGEQFRGEIVFEENKEFVFRE